MVLTKGTTLITFIEKTSQSANCQRANLVQLLLAITKNFKNARGELVIVYL